LKQEKQQHRQDEIDRIAIEGKFGQGKTQVQSGPYNGQTRRDFGNCDYGRVYGDEFGEDTLRLSYFFTLCMAESTDQPGRERHVCMQLIFDAEDWHQNTTA
jgi:hypothetical protein